MDPIEIPPIFIVSGSTCSLGEQVVRTVLAQFSGIHIPVKIFPHVRQAEKVTEIVHLAATSNATIVHSMSDPEMRSVLTTSAAADNVVAIDVIGPLIERLSLVLKTDPIGKPGLYYKLHESYFKRITAINFTIKHDDGKHPEGWPEAEIFLAGVSRIGKTPVSMYLSMQGWKVANMPIVPGIPVPDSIFNVDPRRLVGLTIDPEQLQHHRKQRQRQYKIVNRSAYDDPQKIFEEVEAASRFFRKNGIRSIDVTNKPIETTAGQVIDLVTRRMGD